MTYELLSGERIYLSYPIPEDAEQMAEWYKDMVFMRNVDTGIARPMGKEKIRKQTEEMLGDEHSIYFHIRMIATDELVGFVALHGIEWNNGCATLSIGIGDAKKRGQGYGRESIQLLLAYAFQELNLHRVGLNYISYNPRAEYLYQFCGFVREGVVREYVHRDNAYYDLIYMGILREEWEVIKDEVLR